MLRSRSNAARESATRYAWGIWDEYGVGVYEGNGGAWVEEGAFCLFIFYSWNILEVVMEVVIVLLAQSIIHDSLEIRRGI